MAGRNSLSCYVYTKEGLYIAEYESIASLRRAYYKPDSTIPMFDTHGDFHILPTGDIGCLYRAGKYKIEKFVRSLSDPFLEESASYNRPIEMLNRNGTVIATFSSWRLAKMILNIPENTIYHQLQHPREDFEYLKTNYKFRYKE